MSLKDNSIIYLQRDVSSIRTDLLPGRVLWTNGNWVAAELDVVTFPYAGKKVVMLFEDGRRFVMQDARVEGVIDCEVADAPPPYEDLPRMDFDEDSRSVSVVLERIGEPSSAESRECFRVRTSALNVSVEFGSCSECELTDISQTGFAVLSEEFFELHSVVDVTLPGEDSVVDGHVKILSVRQLRDAWYRYGVAVLGRGLQNACKSLANELQRQVLRRSLSVRA
ncbi:MAG TPA: hypothetical protein EYG03_11810 [Planctomycetes bacterium]|nr:hypothetical protein [Fuerstiella sp.]HIK92653.1 hypothetical protein [Planctomycetota bacterium]